MAQKPVALKHCRLELRIERTKRVITTLLLRPPTLSFLGPNKDRQRRFRRFSAGLERRAAWMANGELELLLVYCSETGCLRAPLLSNTEPIKWRKVHVPIDTYHVKQ